MAIEKTMANIPVGEVKTFPDSAVDNFLENFGGGFDPILNQLLHQAKNKKEETKELNYGLKEFIKNTLIKWTTASSALVNMISAPIRLVDDKGPIKKIINKISMVFTKLHLGSYSVSGLISAMEQKNPLLIFSFLTEGLAAFLGLEKIYLFRGIATGIDGAVAGIKDKYGKSQFSSYSEGFTESMNAVKQSFTEVKNKLSKDPLHLFKMDGNNIAIFASLIAALGGVIGMTINEKIGGSIRDIAGAFGDYGIFSLDNPTAKKSGFAYLAGSLLDFTGRIFNQGVAGLIGISNTGAFTRLKDAFLEAAIACDRIGQYYFLKYNQKSEEELEQEHYKKIVLENMQRKSKSELHNALAI